MARQPRLIVPQQPHHVIQRGNNRQLIFHDDSDYQHFLDWLKECAAFYEVAIHAYVLMPNHVHLLATPQDAQGLALMMQKLGRLYVPWFNHKYGRSGGLFEGRFRTSLIDSEPYFMRCSRYIELNPVRAQLALVPEDYRWSSYAHHAGLRADRLITEHRLFWDLGNTPFQREAAYIGLVQQGLSRDELDSITGAVLKNQPLGSNSFKTELERKTQRQILPAKRGRPTKMPLPPPPVTE